jgi:hypothetical protein
MEVPPAAPEFITQWIWCPGRVRTGAPGSVGLSSFPITCRPGRHRRPSWLEGGARVRPTGSRFGDPAC